MAAKKEVIETKTEDGTDLKLDVRHPSGKDIQDAQLVYTREWQRLTDEEGIKVKRQVDKMLKDKGIWTDKEDADERRLRNRIIKLGKELSDEKVKKTRKRGRELAVEILKTRNELRELLQARSDLDSHTAEALAENVKFDYLVSVCTVYNKDGEKYFTDLEDYNVRRGEKAAYEAASKLAAMIYGGVDFSEKYAENLIEVQFLKKFGFADKDGNFIDPVTKEKVDIEGKPLIAQSDDENVDVYGNKIVDGKTEFKFGGFEEDELSVNPNDAFPANESLDGVNTDSKEEE